MLTLHQPLLAGLITLRAVCSAATLSVFAVRVAGRVAGRALDRLSGGA